LPGRGVGHKEHICDGVSVDEHIKCEWIEELNKIPGIEMRASCYDDKTEVYTDDGFKLFRDVSTDQHVLTLNPESQSLEWSKIVRIFKYPYKGKLKRFKSKSLDLCVSPDHNMVYTLHWNRNKIHFSTPSKMHKKAMFLNKANWTGESSEKININGNDFNMIAFCQFMGYYLSEGSLKMRNGKKTVTNSELATNYSITIAQSNDTTREEMKKNLLGLGVKIREGYKAIYISDKRLGKYLSQFGKSFEKFIPLEIKKLDQKYIKVFLDAYCVGDGHISLSHTWKGSRFSERRVFTTSSKRMADDIGELLIKIGRWPHYYLKETKGKSHKFGNGVYKINHNVWTITDCRSKFIWKYDISDEKYVGFIYDLEAAHNHILLVRKNGRVVWSGNCEGHSDERVAYIVFRLRDGVKIHPVDIVAELNKREGLYSKTDVGSEGKSRIVVAGKTYYGKPGWEKWWAGMIEDLKDVMGKVSKDSYLGFERIRELSKDGEFQYLEFDTSELVPFVWIPEFISLAGSVLYEREDGREPNDIDLIVRAEDEGEDKYKVILDSALRLKIDRVLEEQFGNKSKQWVGTTYGPNWRYQPLFDLVLVPHKPTEIREVNESEFRDRYYKDKGADIEKLHLEEFRSTGVDRDIKNPRDRWKQLFADLRYLSLGYARIKEGKGWGEWKLDDVKRYFAKVVDALRSVYFPILPPNEGDEEYDTDYWKLYRISSSLMKTKPPSKETVKLWDRKRSEIIKEELEKRVIPIFDISKSEDEHIVCGVVYEPDEVDTDGHEASAEEIEKAAYDFMENVRKFKIGHRFEFTKQVSILENVIAPVDFLLEGRSVKHFVKRGTWYMVLRINDMNVWKKIKSGEITGLSMAGKAMIS